jgi:hypothetical protein
VQSVLTDSWPLLLIIFFCRAWHVPAAATIDCLPLHKKAINKGSCTALPEIAVFTDSITIPAPSAQASIFFGAGIRKLPPQK